MMFKLKQLLTYDFKINLSWKDYLKAVLFIVLPNVFFWLVAYWGGAARPIVNQDYLWVSALMVLPFLPVKILGVVLFLGLVFFDVLMLVMQWFPFMDLSAMRYLAPFISVAPARYIVLLVILGAYLLLMPYLLIRFSYGVSKLAVWIECAVLAVATYFVGYVTYYDVPPERFGRDHYYLSASQFKMYEEQVGNTFAILANTVPQLSPYTKETASEHLNQPYSKKILLVVNESWGVARKPEVQRAMLQKLYDLPDLAFIQEGFFDFSGATVQGEMRELCHFAVENGYSFKEVDEQQFASCLPNVLKREGYLTVAMHGSSSHMYDRFSWYRKAGFEKTIFSEDLLEAKRCHIFNGVCDSELYQQVSDVFKQAGNQPVMFYWLTLTSHVPYESKDIVNTRLDCDKFDLAKGDVCNNMMMQTQFFDGLADLLRQPEMKGVEVLVVGDHMPPIMQNVPIHHYLRWNDVSWVHLKVKE